jgi:replicative DNA helicase
MTSTSPTLPTVPDLVFTDPERLALAGFLAGYRGLTRDAYALDLRQFLSCCERHGLKLFSVRRTDIELYARAVEEAGRARATVARRLCTVAGFYRYAEEEGLVPTSPAVHVRRLRLGKTSLAQQLALAMIGVRPPSLLGFYVEPVKRLLYLACDRPAQAKRSMRRMVSETDRARLDEGLVLWEGPLPFDVAREPGALLVLVRSYDCEALAIDSLKDVAADPSREETGMGLQRAFQACVAENIDVVALHHQRKAQNGAGKPNRLSDVYGSRWITAGCGSVVMLWGEPGDPVVDLTHLKQPDEEVGPFQVVHDHLAGTSSVVEHVDAYTIVMRSAHGVTAAEVASALFGDEARNSREKARRQLDRLVAEKKIFQKEGSRGGTNGGEPTRYYATSPHEGSGDNA